LTETTSYHPGVNLGTPTVDQLTAQPVVGQSAQFKLTAVLPGSTTFTYTWSDSQPVTVPVGADGTTTVTITPTAPFTQELTVFTTTASGIQSGSSDDFIDVATNAPQVTSTDYPRNQFAGEVGKPGTFTFKAGTSDTVSFTYTFDNGTPVTV